jgi:hypothetical protein
MHELTRACGVSTQVFPERRMLHNHPRGCGEAGRHRRGPFRRSSRKRRQDYHPWMRRSGNQLGWHGHLWRCVISCHSRVHASEQAYLSWCGGVSYLVTHVCTSTSLHGHVSEQTCVLQDTVTPTDLVNVNTPMAATAIRSTRRVTPTATPTATHTATHTATIWSWGRQVKTTDTGTDTDKGTSPR